jgi:hypothetical protein
MTTTALVVQHFVKAPLNTTARRSVKAREDDVIQRLFLHRVLRSFSHDDRKFGVREWEQPGIICCASTNDISHN